MENPGGLEQCSTRCSAFAPIPQISPGCYFYKFLIDGEWKNVPGFEQQFSILIFSPASGAGVTENEDEKLVLVLIVEEEEEGEGQGGKGDEANIQKEKRKRVKGENHLERDQRRASVGTN